MAAACALAAARRFSLQSPAGFPEEESLPASPTRGWGGWGRRRLPRPSWHQAGHATGKGRCPRGLTQGAVPKSVLPGKRSGKRDERPPLRGQPAAPGAVAVPGGGDRTPRAARIRPGPGLGQAPGVGVPLSRRSAFGQGTQWPRARAPAPRPRSLPGQCGFPRAREASQEVEVFPKAVAARRCHPRGRPRRRLLRLLSEAQPPKGFKETVLHGEGASREDPRFPFLKSRSWPKLLFL